MKDKIAQFLRGVSLKNSETKARQLVASQFEGTTTSNCRYVKIGEIEYRITKNPENIATGGWDIREMNWGIGNDWRFSKPY